MSTILKALKRVDQTTPPPDDVQSWPPPIDTKEAVKGRLYRRWLRRKVLIALIVVLIVVAAGWLLYGQKQRLVSKIWPPKSSEKAPKFKAKLESPQRSTAQPAPDTAVALNRRTPPSGVKPDQKQIGANRPAREIPRSPRQPTDQKKQVATSTPKTRTPATAQKAQSDLPRAPATETRRSEPGQTRAPAVAPTPKSRASQAKRSYQRLDDSILKLQAIAWSNEATRRIAVINNRVVREGESVEGFSIRQIRQDDVVVNDGTQSWQLEFALR